MEGFEGRYEDLGGYTVGERGGVVIGGVGPQRGVQPTANLAQTMQVVFRNLLAMQGA